MNGDRQYNGLQLISPPPEESLRRQSKAFSPAPNVKRKRSQVPPEEMQPVTPNPRLRKQQKQRDRPGSPSPLQPRSPHAQNPNADYIPQPFSRRSRSKSTTPIPPYDPPRDVFTPPKEVFVTPITATIKVSKSSKRKSTTKKKSRPTPQPVLVKLEMPDVDLTAPMPPPSPGDDPLLLSSSIEPPSSTPTRPTRSPWAVFSESDALPVDRDVDVRPVRRTVSPPPSLPFHKLRFDDLPPSSPPVENLDQHHSSPIVEDEDLDITPPEMPFFDIGDNANADDGWSDSVDEFPMLPPPEGSPTKEGEGEYTGKWLEVLVKTKPDTPSSAMKGRMDAWNTFTLSLEKRRQDLDAVKEAEEREDEEMEEEEEVRMMSVEPEERTNPFDFSGIESLPDERLDSMAVEVASAQEEEQHEEETSEEYVVPLRDEEDGSLRPGTPQVDEEVFEEAPTAEDAFQLMGNQPCLDDQDGDIEDDEEAQITIDEDPLPSSIEEEEHNSILNPPVELDLAQSPQEEPSIEIQVDHDPDVSDEDIPSSSSSDTSPSPDIVKITSADPRAAARAAAILKQHNYDCFTKKEMKRRLSARWNSSFGAGASASFAGVGARGVLGGGVMKNKERRRSVGGVMMGVRGEEVYIPGSPMTTTLPKLLRDAEAEVSLSFNLSNLSVCSAPADLDAGGESPNPFALRTSKEGADSYKTPVPARVFAPALTANADASSSMTGLAKKMDKSLMLLTPKVPMTPGETCYDPLTGERMWTKEEWKRLDACFTDERLEVGVRLGLVKEDCCWDEMMSGMLEEGKGWEKCEGMAGVDEVKLEDVVRRFVEWMGGWEEVDMYGLEWSRENMMSRARALRSKQRKGNVAPPTSLPFSPASRSSNALASMASPSPFDFGSFGNSTMDVPEFTPIRRRPLPVFSRLKRQWPSFGPSSSTPVNHTQGEMEVCGATTSTPVPPSLLAPRYSHLLEEAVRVSKDRPDVSSANVSREEEEEEEEEEREGERDQGTEQETQSDTVLEDDRGSDDAPTTLVEGEEQSFGSELTEELVEGETEELEPEPEPGQQATIGNRVKGIIFSYLPTLKKSERPKKLRSRPSHRPGLPIPPKEILAKPRGPVVTPAREPLPKTVPPKDLVQLQQAPPIQTVASKIPRVVHPKQLVELNHVTPKVADEKKRKEKQRRSSGSSVKDLVKGFEQMEKEQEKKREVRKVKSVGEWRKDVGSANVVKGGGEPGRPVWRF